MDSERTKFNLNFRELKKFNPVLFSCLGDQIQKIVSSPKRGLFSRIANIVINLLGKIIFLRSSIKNKQHAKYIYAFKNKVSFSNANAKFFLEALEKAEIVSFDIFDTLLVRKVTHPKDLFKLIESELNAEGFYHVRIFAELRARAQLKKEDVSIKDIYRFIPYRYRNFLSIEKSFERLQLERNPIAYKYYQMAIAQKKHIIAISDMYLDADFLKDILHKQGFTEIDAVFVSNELNATKSTGQLFQTVAKRLKVSPNQILHLGDNYSVDFQTAQKEGLHAVWLPQISLQLEYERKKYTAMGSDLSSSIHNSLVCRYQSIGNIWHVYGYMLGGPLVLSFLCWLKHRCYVNQTDHLAFIGRDGWILKRMFDKFLSTDTISSSYVYLPRIVSLLSTLSYNGNPVYLEYILHVAKEEGVSVKSTASLNDNIAEFNNHMRELIQWSSSRKYELECHLRGRIKNVSKPAFVDLTSMWLSALSAGHKILGDKNENNYILWFFGNFEEVKVGDLPFESAIDVLSGGAKPFIKIIILGSILI